MTNLLLLCRFHHMACHEDGVVISARADAPRGAPSWRFTTRDGEPFLGDRSEHGMPGWKDSEWLLWHGLDGSAGWDDPEANRIRPLWAGERFSLADTVSMLFANPRRRPAEAPDQGTDVGDQIAA